MRGKAAVGGTTTRGTARQRHSMLLRCEEHDSTFIDCLHRTSRVHSCCQQWDMVQGAWRSKQGLVLQPAQGGGLLGLGFTLLQH